MQNGEENRSFWRRLMASVYVHELPNIGETTCNIMQDFKADFVLTLPRNANEDEDAMFLSKSAEYLILCLLVLLSRTENRSEILYVAASPRFDQIRYCTTTENHPNSEPFEAIEIVSRTGDSRNAYSIERPMGRPRRRWEDNIKKDLREVEYDARDWIILARIGTDGRLIKNNTETDQEEEKELVGSLAEKKLPIEGCTGRNGEREKSSE
ncbi:hypothetical protein ANN_18644 [Periplaneta americana]|uniref:Uncharacterized protein n=1 Tax=Periplaneta americana TaxID=6978 RepID=A0ABQ8SPB0_PERAM|nr:hypothetical protein ANN_18644 [Periplaneta americana]